MYFEVYKDSLNLSLEKVRQLRLVICHLGIGRRRSVNTAGWVQRTIVITIDAWWNFLNISGERLKFIRCFPGCLRMLSIYFSTWKVIFYVTDDITYDMFEEVVYQKVVRLLKII